VNWWQIAGFGETRDKALENLQTSLDSVRETRPLPRPGTGLPIEFASTDGIDRYWGVVSRIIEEVLGFESDGIFVSDESSLYDFESVGDVVKFQAQIKQIYGVDVSTIDSGNLVEIAQKITSDP